MMASSTKEDPDLLTPVPQRANADAATRESAMAPMTLATFVAAPSSRARRTRILLLLLLLTLAAGWTDALCYLAVGRVFASFMTGNILFVGLSVAQGDSALLLRAGVGIVLFLASVTLGSRYLQARPARATAARWRGTFADYLLVEGLILLVFALLWALTGNPTQHPAIQVILLGVAAFGMGLQGALVAALNIPDVVSVALTGTELLLGIRLAQRIGRQAVDRPAETSALFLFLLMLSYALAALIVAWIIPWSAPVAAFIPCLLAAVAAGVLKVPARRQAIE